MSINDAIADENVKVMDKAALAMAQEQNLDIIVFNLKDEGNIAKAASGERIGTKVS
jgi:uridylate kinase